MEYESEVGEVVNAEVAKWDEDDAECEADVGGKINTKTAKDKTADSEKQEAGSGEIKYKANPGGEGNIRAVSDGRQKKRRS